MSVESKSSGDILSLLSEGVRLNVQGAVGSSFAYLAARVWIGLKRPVLIVCKGFSEANSLQDDVAYFTQAYAPGPVEVFPAPTALPYTHLIPQADTWIERLKVLYTIENEGAPLIIAPIDALLRKVPPKEAFYNHIEHVSIGQKLDREGFLTRAVTSGYNNSPLVEEEGDFASRGGLIDIWSPAADRPVRIELDGDTVASIRSFDPATQRTSYSVDRLTIVPVRSVMLDESVVAAGLKRLKAFSDDIGVSAVERREYAGSIRSGIYPAYTETLLPVFHADSCFLWDYLKDETVFFMPDPVGIREAYVKFWDEMNVAYDEARHIEKAVHPKDLYMEYADWLEVVKEKRSVTVNDVDLLTPMGGAHLTPSTSLRAGPAFSPEGSSGGPPWPPDKADTEAGHYMLARKSVRVATSTARPPAGRWIEGSSQTALAGFVAQLNRWGSEGVRVVMTCHTSMQADRLIDLLRWQGMAPIVTDRPFMEICPLTPSPLPLGERARGGIFITIGKLSEGFCWPDEGVVALSETEMFGKKRKRLLPPSRYPTEAFTSYQDLADGDWLVHIQHGVGRYKGMRQMEFASMVNDFLRIEYLGGDKLYVPAYRLNQVQKYVGPGDTAPFLDKLGGSRWERAKLKANRAVRRMAAELIKLYAVRRVKEGFGFSGRDHLMEEFETAFPYDETPDQMQAIEDVIKDMAETHPADRLICGDVGYGKTEVAMRAAYRAAMDGKQVAVLVPTTILAFQHFETFIDRFKKTPITIELLNRFRTQREQARVAQGLKKGTVDIVIGTHRLLQRDIKFHDLGLLIVDEEHRFGVRQKEAIKRIKATVDVISMSATPIPRTLNISLVGARDISVINTPPADRLSIRTYVAEFDEGLIRGAVLKEIRRGGQLFFVHNRVETIESMRKRLGKLLPEVRVCVAHGQMKERELEKIMVAFVKREYDLLLTTTIIESGLDIPTANTIIVNRADTFGLAQLYQIRGRVGRSNIQAYAYLLIPDEASITSVAAKRLHTLQRYTELGSGFQIAMHDLEIRGAGNILGAEQSGHISAVGYELYTELLEREIRRLKGEEGPAMVDTEIQMPIEAYLPSSYIEDDGTRMVFYKRISAIKDEAGLDEISAELKDRFGDLPQVAANLLKVVEIKAKAGTLGIESVQVSKGNFAYRFSNTTPVSAASILQLVRENQERMRIKPNSTVLISEDISSEKDIFSAIRRHLSEF